jgi:Au+-exporting ATPase
VTDMGVRAMVDGARVEVGADRYMRSLGLDVEIFGKTDDKSPLYAAIDGRLRSLPWPIRYRRRQRPPFPPFTSLA